MYKPEDARNSHIIDAKLAKMNAICPPSLYNRGQVSVTRSVCRCAWVASDTKLVILVTIKDVIKLCPMIMEMLDKPAERHRSI